MTIPGAWITTVANPALYTFLQLDRACKVAHLLGRGQFVLCERPQREVSA